MADNSLQKLLGKQYLIAAYIEAKLQIVNFIKEGYDANKPILINNRFLHFTAHTYYRSIAIDLYALFGPANNHNKNSFLHIDDTYRSLLVPNSIEAVNTWIVNDQQSILIIKDLRHKQIAHYDFTFKEAISLNFDNLNHLNTLFALAKKIITFYGQAFSDDAMKTGYSFDRRHQYVASLERLINSATQY